MAKKNSNLRLGEWWDYTPYKLNQQSEAALRAEYARLRKIALARGEALAIALLKWMYEQDRGKKQ